MAREINSGKSALPITGSEATSSELTGGQATKVENAAAKLAFARRVVIENVQPEVDCGRFPIKRTIGERVRSPLTSLPTATTSCTPFCDIARQPRRTGKKSRWSRSPTIGGRAEFRVGTRAAISTPCKPGLDHFQSWSRDLEKKFEAAQDISVDILTGVQLIEAAAARASRKGQRSFSPPRAAEITKAGRHGHAEARSKIIEPGAESSDDPERGSPPRNHLQQGTGGHRRSRKGPLQRLVRDVPAFLLPSARPARNSAGLHQEAGLRCRHGLRRSLPSAHSPHRPR